MARWSRARIQHELKKLGQAALIVGSIFLMLELLLAFVDPWGIAYFNDLLRMGNEHFEVDETRGYKMLDGTYRFSDWRATIEDGARVTPDSNTDSACSLVLLGDSVTFAHGVNDAQTWANQLAQQVPDVTIINTGMTTYNSSNALGSKQAFPDADAYIYLIVYNDIEPALNPDPYAFPGQNPTRLPFIVRYVSFAMFGRQPSEFEEQTLPSRDDPNMQRFLGDIEAIMADDDTVLFSFDNSPLTDFLRDEGYEVQEYPYLQYQNSYVDNHWNARGNREFADLITPFVRDIMTTRCEDS